MAAPNHIPIKLTITGARAQRGVSLSDFEAFIENFLRALRDYDRSGRGEPTKPTGHPDRRAEAVSAFRLIGFQTGSGVAFIEPETIDDEDQLQVSDEPLSLATLRSMAADVGAGRELPRAVLDSLTRACAAAGADGSVSIALPGVSAPVVVDRASLARSSGPEDGAPPVTTVSGRLHLIDVEPGRVGIRTAAGIEWSCRYPEGLERRVTTLIGQVVWVEGAGALATPMRGSMALERIESLEAEQGTLFTAVPATDAELSNAQGIERAQGIHSLADPGWDDEADGAYLAALLGR